MAEFLARPEVKNYTPLLPLQARLMIYVNKNDSSFLDPRNKFNKDQVKAASPLVSIDILDQTFTIIEHASIKERKAAAGFTNDKIDEAIGVWAEKNAKVINKKKGVDLLRKIFDVKAEKVSSEDMVTFYKKYFQNGGGKQSVQLFIHDVVSYYVRDLSINVTGLKNDIDTIQSLAGAFGSMSSEVIAQLVEAEVQFMKNTLSNSDRLSQEINNISSGDDNERLLKFLIEEEQLDTPKPIPPTPVPPTPRPQPEEPPAPTPKPVPTEPPVVTETPKAEVKDDLPDWMKPSPPALQAEVKDDLPDWMKPAVAAPEAPQSEVRGDLPDWIVPTAETPTRPTAPRQEEPAWMKPPNQSSEIAIDENSTGADIFNKLAEARKKSEIDKRILDDYDRKNPSAITDKKDEPRSKLFLLAEKSKQLLGAYEKLIQGIEDEILPELLGTDFETIKKNILNTEYELGIRQAIISYTLKYSTTKEDADDLLLEVSNQLGFFNRLAQVRGVPNFKPTNIEDLINQHELAITHNLIEIKNGNWMKKTLFSADTSKSASAESKPASPILTTEKFTPVNSDSV